MNLIVNSVGDASCASLYNQNDFYNKCNNNSPFPLVIDYGYYNHSGPYYGKGQWCGESVIEQVRSVIYV